MAGLRKPIFYNIAEDVDATVSACYSIEDVCYDYVWFLQAYTTGTNANLIISVEASNDLIHWDKWSYCESEIEPDDSVSFKDSYFGAKHMRVCIDPNGNTTGTVSINVNLKTV